MMEYQLRLKEMKAFFEPVSFNTLTYLGFLQDLIISQKDMTEESTQRINLHYEMGIDAVKIKMEPPRPAQILIKGSVMNESEFKPRVQDVVFTPSELRFRWGMKDNLLEYVQPLAKVAYFCIYANPVPKPTKEEYPNHYRRNSENY